MERRKIIIVGAGAAGLAAAAAALDAGAEVTVLERSEKAGKKIYITGKGRCNYTNVCETQDFFAQVVRNPKFLYSAVYGYDQSAVTEFLEENGCRTKVERGMRAFPESDHASDVTKAFTEHIRKRGGKILCRKRVTEILTKEDGGERRCVGVKADGQIFPADAVVVATGGMSYPSTGSTGDGYRFAEVLGLRVEPPRPALVPLETKEEWVYDLQGLSLKNVSLRLDDPRPGKKKPLWEGFGEMLFTHFGMSGPLVLSASSYCDFSAAEEYTLHLDLKPALTAEQLTQRMQREAEAEKNRTFPVFFRSFLPERLAKTFAMLFLGVDPGTPAEETPRVRTANEQDFRRAAALMKDLTVHAKGTRGFAEAIVTAGGVNVREINPSTMEVKAVPGLYLCGELVDVNAMTGGFNLQIAWSTGHLAGLSAAGAE